LDKGKIVPVVLLPHEAQYTLLSSLQSVNRSRSVNFQCAPEQELKPLFRNRNRSQKSDSGHLWFEPKIFREQMYCIEESDIVGTFRRPQWFSAQGIVPPCLPQYGLAHNQNMRFWAEYGWSWL